MRRQSKRSLVLLALAALGGCGEDPPAPAQQEAAGSRFESVGTVQGDVDQVLRENCDKSYDAASAPTWQWPATDQRPAATPGKWTWVNFWATWCHPCVEELPMLARKLEQGPMVASFLSVDADAETVARFRTEHSITFALPRVTDSNTFQLSMRGVGVNEQQSLPVHVLVDAAGKARCVRAGSVEERHVDAILGALGVAAARPRIR